MMGSKCPVCGDAQPYILWVDDEPPEGCADDLSWQEGGPITIKSVTECPRQMKSAWQAAEFRKLVPDAFDANGIIIPGQIGRVLEAFGNAHPDKELVMG